MYFYYLEITTITPYSKYFQVHILTFIKVRSHCHIVLKSAFSVKYFSNFFI